MPRNRQDLLRFRSPHLRSVSVLSVLLSLVWNCFSRGTFFIVDPRHCRKGTQVCVGVLAWYRVAHVSGTVISSTAGSREGDTPLRRGKRGYHRV